MKKIFGSIILMMIVLGLFPNQIKAENINDDRIISATETIEMKKNVVDLVNSNPDKLFEILFYVATGSKTIPEGTSTVEINLPQFNRWFNTTSSNSFIGKSSWELMKTGIEQNKKQRVEIKERVETNLPSWFPNQTKRDLIQSKIDLLYYDAIIEDPN